MIKKLDKLILRAFVGPFIATFLISLFVLVMQFFWLWIDDFVGKGLDVFTIAKMIGFVAATCVPLALPLSLLLSSIMTFGSMGESFELVAIKSSGVPLTRFMRPLTVVTILLSLVAFYFANNLIPIANLKMNRMRYDIVKTKPALDIKAGIFYDKMTGFVIKIGEKDKDNMHIRDIIILEKNQGLQDNLMVAKSGLMSMTPDKSSLQFILNDGWRYEEEGRQNDLNTQFTRTGFKEYKKLFDLSTFKMTETNEEGFKSDPKMLTVGQLTPSIDSLYKLDTLQQIRRRNDLTPYFYFVRYQDSTWVKANPKSKLKKAYFTTFNDSTQLEIVRRINNSIQSVKSNLEVAQNDNKSAQETIRKYKIEWHRKFTLSAACLILFLIGAPLGSIIRKGGLGAPLLFAIIFFVVFYIFNTVGEKIAKQGVVPVWAGMWLSSAILLPVGIFLMVKALNDSQILGKEVWFRIGKTIKKILPQKKKGIEE